MSEHSPRRVTLDPSKLHFVFALPESERRFRELLLYICEKSATDPKFGATKLNKILYFSDFLAFARYGKPITGFEYQRERNGPVPKRLVSIRNQMGVATLERRPVTGNISITARLLPSFESQANVTESARSAVTPALEASCQSLDSISLVITREKREELGARQICGNHAAVRS